MTPSARGKRVSCLTFSYAVAYVAGGLSGLPSSSGGIGGFIETALPFRSRGTRDPTVDPRFYPYLGVGGGRGATALPQEATRVSLPRMAATERGPPVAVATSCDPPVVSGRWRVGFRHAIASRKAVPADIKDQPPLLGKTEIVYHIPPWLQAGILEIEVLCAVNVAGIQFQYPIGHWQHSTRLGETPRPTMRSRRSATLPAYPILTGTVPFKSEMLPVLPVSSSNDQLAIGNIGTGNIFTLATFHVIHRIQHPAALRQNALQRATSFTASDPFGILYSSSMSQ